MREQAETEFPSGNGGNIGRENQRADQPKLEFAALSGKTNLGAEGDLPHQVKCALSTYIRDLMGLTGEGRGLTGDIKAGA